MDPPPPPNAQTWALLEALPEHLRHRILSFVVGWERELRRRELGTADARPALPPTVRPLGAARWRLPAAAHVCDSSLFLSPVPFLTQDALERLGHLGHEPTPLAEAVAAVQAVTLLSRAHRLTAATAPLRILFGMAGLLSIAKTWGALKQDRDENRFMQRAHAILCSTLCWVVARRPAEVVVSDGDDWDSAVQWLAEACANGGLAQLQELDAHVEAFNFPTAGPLDSLAHFILRAFVKSGSRQLELKGTWSAARAWHSMAPAAEDGSYSPWSADNAVGQQWSSMRLEDAMARAARVFGQVQVVQDDSSRLHIVGPRQGHATLWLLAAAAGAAAAAALAGFALGRLQVQSRARQQGRST
eukprot:scaffold11.g4047.t1